MKPELDWPIRISDSLVRLTAPLRWMALAMVAITLTVVVLRYVFSTSAIVLQEAVMYLHGALFMLMLPAGIRLQTHVRVDVLYSKLSSRRQLLIDTLGHSLFLLPVAGFILVTSLPYVSASWQVWEGSPEVGGIHGVFLLKTLIPVAAGLLLLQGLAEIACNVLALLHGTDISERSNDATVRHAADGKDSNTAQDNS